jgi:hypothetical protein
VAGKHRLEGIRWPRGYYITLHDITGDTEYYGKVVGRIIIGYGENLTFYSVYSETFNFTLPYELLSESYRIYKPMTLEDLIQEPKPATNTSGPPDFYEHAREAKEQIINDNALARTNIKNYAMPLTFIGTLLSLGIILNIHSNKMFQDLNLKGNYTIYVLILASITVFSFFGSSSLLDIYANYRYPHEDPSLWDSYTIPAIVNIIDPSNPHGIPITLARSNSVLGLTINVQSINVTEHEFSSACYGDGKRETGIWEKDLITFTVYNYGSLPVTILDPVVKVCLDVGLPYYIELGNASIAQFSVDENSNVSKSVVIEQSFRHIYFLYGTSAHASGITGVDTGKLVFKLKGTTSQLESETEIDLAFDLPAWQVMSWWTE